MRRAESAVWGGSTLTWPLLLLDVYAEGEKENTCEYSLCITDLHGFPIDRHDLHELGRCLFVICICVCCCFV